MNFFLDENFPKKAIPILKERNFSVFDIRGTSQEGLPDSDLFQLAKQKKAVFLTTDNDFYHTIHFTEKPHHGIVVIALKKPNSKAILEKLIWVLNNIGKFTFKDECLLLTDTKCVVFK